MQNLRMVIDKKRKFSESNSWVYRDYSESKECNSVYNYTNLQEHFLGNCRKHEKGRRYNI